MPDDQSNNGNGTHLRPVSRSDQQLVPYDPMAAQPGKWSQQTVAMSDIRESPLQDLILGDGDIVMVERGPIRAAWTGAWETLSRLVFLGFRPLAP